EKRGYSCVTGHHVRGGAVAQLEHERCVTGLSQSKQQGNGRCCRSKHATHNDTLDQSVCCQQQLGCICCARPFKPSKINMIICKRRGGWRFACKIPRHL